MPNVVFASANNPQQDFTEEEREGGFYSEDGYLLLQDNRPAINPDFAPDYSCLFDTYQAKCIPGSEQECPEGLGGNNDDETCVPEHDQCPEGYNTEDDDETGQCQPNEECESYDDYVLLTDRGERKGDRCSALHYLCNEDGQREEEYCIEYCNEDPDRMGCKSEVS